MAKGKLERIVLVHLSDIHMGSVRNGFYGPSRLRSGLNGHDPALCRRLKRALRQVRRILAMEPSEPLHVIVSGDLTCVGLATEMSLAATFLRSVLTIDGVGTQTAGLHVPSDRLSAVPGNHDHWQGRYHWPYQPAYDPSIFNGRFDQTPWQFPHAIESPTKSLQLHLFGVDSNSGLAGYRYNDTAMGLLSHNELYHPHTGLELLLLQSRSQEQVLARSGVRVVRAVLCHHAFSNHAKGKPPVSKTRAMFSPLARRLYGWFVGQCPDPLDQSSVNELLKLARRFEVKAVLTGHTHSPYSERFTLQGSPAVWELRSSTALQGPARTGVQGFCVHEIILEPSGPPIWRYRDCIYGTGRFCIPLDKDALTLH